MFVNQINVKIMQFVKRKMTKLMVINVFAVQIIQECIVKMKSIYVKMLIVKNLVRNFNKKYLLSMLNFCYFLKDIASMELVSVIHLFLIVKKNQVIPS